MKSAFYILSISFYLTGCQSTDKPVRNYYPRDFVIQKPNAVKEYFSKNNWSFPFQMDSLQLIEFSEYRDSLQIFPDSNKIQNRRTVLFAKAILYFMTKELDTSCSYWFTHPSMYRSGGSEYYCLFVERYENNRNPRADCECANLDSGRVFGHGGRMRFKILRHDSLAFDDWRD